jgi:hypothetical protein
MIPGTMKKLRCYYIALDERARLLQPGSREDNWVHEYIQNSLKAGTADMFPNQATFGNVMDEMSALARFWAQVHRLMMCDLS